jgi:hypothetical protein
MGASVQQISNGSVIPILQLQSHSFRHKLVLIMSLIERKMQLL